MTQSQTEQGGGFEPKTGDPEVCARCAAKGRTCCQAPGRDEAAFFPLSRPEWERIVEVMGDKGGFAEVPNSKPFLAAASSLFPGEETAVRRLFPETKTHLRLATKPDGACVFLGRDGCSLPREVRPWYCRLYPYWVSGERPVLLHAPDCLARREHPSARALMAKQGVTAAMIKTLYGRLRLAWGLNPPLEDLSRNE